MNWIQRIDQSTASIFNQNNTLPVIYKTRRIEIDNTNAIFTYTTQFFLSLTLLNPINKTFLSIQNEADMLFIIPQIAAHYDKVQVSYDGNTPVSLSLSDIKKEAIQGIENAYDTNGLHPFIKELFYCEVTEFKEVLNETSYLDTSQLKYDSVFKLINNEVEHYSQLEFMKTWTNIQTLYHEDEEILITPRNWRLKDSLKDKLVLRFLAANSKSVYLLSDEKSEKVIYVLVKF